MSRPPRIPLSGPQLLLYKLRTGGLGWLSQRLREEWHLPRTATGQALYRGARALGRAVSWSPRAGISDRDDLLYAFYDLSVAPVTFDFLWFLAGAELERRRRDLRAVHVAIVPGRYDGLRRETPEYEARISPAARRSRIAAMLVPACAFLPTLSGITVASSREQAAQLVDRAGAVFPQRYEPALPRYPGPQEPLRAAREEGARIGVLRARDQDSRVIDEWLARRGCSGDVVTITLRSYDHTPERNSNIAAWAAFARGLDPARFSVVFVPDTAQCLEPASEILRGFPVFGEAALVLGLRMALYERAYLNLGVNNGPMGLCWLNERSRYITFKILSEAAPNTSADYMRFLGFEIGRSLPFATSWQQWVWAEDELPVIEQAFAEMVRRIDGQATPSASASAVAAVAGT